VVQFRARPYLELKSHQISINPGGIVTLPMTLMNIPVSSGKNSNMVVFINNKEISIFKGATLRDVVIAYSKQSYKKVLNGSLGIYDRFGFLTESDGPANEGQHFYLKVRHKQE
jgi:hypothetical protein